MIELVIRNISNRKMRTFLTLLGIIIGISAIISLVAIADGLQGEANRAFEKVQRIQVGQKGAWLPLFSKVPVSYVGGIEKIQGVKLVSPRIEYTPNKIDGKEVSGGLSLTTASLFPPTVIGVDPKKESQSTASTLVKYITNGRFLVDGDRYSAVIGKPVADTYRKTVGSKIDIDGVKFKVVGTSEAGSFFLDNNIVVPLDTIRGISELGTDEVSGIAVDVGDPSEADSVATRIELKYPDVDASTPQETASSFGSLLSAIRSSTFVIASIAAVVGGIGITNSMLMSVMERRREIGILKAVGWSNREVIRMFLAESVIVGIMGGIVGISLGLGGVFAVQTLRPDLVLSVSPNLVAQAFVFALSLGIFGGLYPAWRATQVSPIEALRYE